METRVEAVQTDFRRVGVASEAQKKGCSDAQKLALKPRAAITEKNTNAEVMQNKPAVKPLEVSIKSKN